MASEACVRAEHPGSTRPLKRAEGSANKDTNMYNFDKNTVNCKNAGIYSNNTVQTSFYNKKTVKYFCTIKRINV